MTVPKLNPPCPYWREDLPGPDELPVLVSSLEIDAPNHQDDVFLEIPRALALARGWLIWLAPITAFYLIMLLWSFFTTQQRMGVEIWIALILGVLVGVWSLLFCVKFEVAPPRDLPLRFNRARQRIYAYNFKYSLWNPFVRWRVEPVAYDWSQVRAERWGVSAAAKSGVELSIVKPGTNEVIDRFPLTAMGADAHAWAYVCTYMQQGPDALPPPGPPWDHNFVLWCNVAMLLAPKVEWPADMDLESTTAP